MKKGMVSRGLIGFPIGIAIGHIISVVISLLAGDGGFLPCTPELTALMGSEIGAVVLQTLLCGVIGTSFSASSVIWEMERWSIVRQTGSYFSINAAVMLPIACLLGWTERSVTGVLSYLGIFMLIFMLIWAMRYLALRYILKRMNERILKTGDLKA